MVGVKWQLPIATGKVGMVTVTTGQSKQQSKSLTCRDLWSWLVYHGISGSEICMKPMKFLLDLYKQKNSRSTEQKSNANHKKREL